MQLPPAKRFISSRLSGWKNTRQVTLKYDLKKRRQVYLRQLQGCFPASCVSPAPSVDLSVQTCRSRRCCPTYHHRRLCTVPQRSLTLSPSHRLAYLLTLTTPPIMHSLATVKPCTCHIRVSNFLTSAYYRP